MTDLLLRLAARAGGRTRAPRPVLPPRSAAGRARSGDGPPGAVREETVRVPGAPAPDGASPAPARRTARPAPHDGGGAPAGTRRAAAGDPADPGGTVPPPAGAPVLRPAVLPGRRITGRPGEHRTGPGPAPAVPRAAPVTGPAVPSAVPAGEPERPDPSRRSGRWGAPPAGPPGGPGRRARPDCAAGPDGAGPAVPSSAPLPVPVPVPVAVPVTGPPALPVAVVPRSEERRGAPGDVPAPVVRISIGRVEIRAVPPSAAPPPAVETAGPGDTGGSGGALSLADFLSGGGSR